MTNKPLEQILKEKLEHLRKLKEQDKLYELLFIAEQDSSLPAGKRKQLYESFLSKEPEDAHIAGVIHNNFAELLGNELGDYESAERHLKKALKFAEKDFARTGTEDARKRLNNYQANLCVCRQNLDLINKNKSKQLCNSGLSKQASGDLEGALDDLSEAIRLDSSNRIFYMARSQVYREMRKPDLAEKDMAEYNRLLKR